jgi:hypothetical protein
VFQDLRSRRCFICRCPVEFSGAPRYDEDGGTVLQEEIVARILSIYF